MPLWFFIALAGPAIYGIGSYYDKYLLSRFAKRSSPTVLMVFTGIFGCFVSLFIGLAHPAALQVSVHDAFLVILAGALFLVGLIPYLYALRGEEATAVVPLFQLMPIMYLFFGWLILKETLGPQELLGGGVVLVGALILSTDKVKGILKLKTREIGLMIIATSLVALGSTLFKFVAIENDFWSANFWNYLGEGAAAAVILIASPKVRNMSFNVLRKDGVAFMSANVFSDSLSLSAALCVHFAMLLGPIALVSLVNGFQPFFLLLYGAIWSRLFPQFGIERLSGSTLIRKILATIIMFAGIALISLA